MAKKQKGKRLAKQSNWTSPPPTPSLSSPKQADAEDVPSLSNTAPDSPGSTKATPVETSLSQLITSLPESAASEAPVVDAPGKEEVEAENPSIQVDSKLEGAVKVDSQPTIAVSETKHVAEEGQEKSSLKAVPDPHTTPNQTDSIKDPDEPHLTSKDEPTADAPAKTAPDVNEPRHPVSIANEASPDLRTADTAKSDDSINTSDPQPESTDSQSSSELENTPEAELKAPGPVQDKVNGSTPQAPSSRPTIEANVNQPALLPEDPNLLETDLKVAPRPTSADICREAPIDCTEDTKTPQRASDVPKTDTQSKPKPAAPSPPSSKARPRHPLDPDTDEDLPVRRRTRTGYSSLSRSQTEIAPRLSHSSTFPNHSQQPRVFASRVPSDQYSLPPHPPPGYHTRFHPHTPPGAPPHYHNMSQPNPYTNPTPYGPSPHVASPYQQPWGEIGPPFGPYDRTPAMHRHDSVASRDYAMGPRSIENGSAIEDDSGDPVSRLSKVIPDLQEIIFQHRDLQGTLGMHEDLIRRSQAQQAEEVKRKDDHIDGLTQQLEALKRDSSAETNKFRLQIGNMEEQMRELRDRLAEHDRLKKENQDKITSLDDENALLKTQKADMEKSHAEDIEKTINEAKERSQKDLDDYKEESQKDFEDWKTQATATADTEKIALAVEFDKKLKEHEVQSEDEKAKATAEFVRQKDEMRSEHQRQQRERETNFDKVRKDLEAKLGTAQKAREEAMKHERESREVWESERETLIKGHQEDRDSLQRGWDEQRELMDAQYKKNKDESDKAWIELHADATNKADEERAKAEQLTKEKTELQKSVDDLKVESQKEKEVIESVAGNLETERKRLEKLVQCYGDITDIKSKGDTYYLDSFSQLSKQILDLANTHFTHLPVTPPPDVLALIPAGLPSLLGDTNASRLLRSAYISHLVSNILTARVFGPFLFSLGRRYDKADGLFTSMSNHLRGKSTRKEAIWRQHTLVAAFTSSGAKQRINTAAGSVVEEIVNAIKDFTDRKEEEAIRLAVRRIVKIAAETWRFARLEREMIVAKMPSVEDEDEEHQGPEFWAAYDFENALAITPDSSAEDKPTLLLRLFPLIEREAVHECFQFSEEDKCDAGCIYSHGLALYTNSQAVVDREEELRQAGLPKANTQSPSAADFPPPLIPPPRNPPPLAPRSPASSTAKPPSPPPLLRSPPPPPQSPMPQRRTVTIPPTSPPRSPILQERSTTTPIPPPLQSPNQSEKSVTTQLTPMPQESTATTPEPPPPQSPMPQERTATTTPPPPLALPRSYPSAMSHVAGNENVLTLPSLAMSSINPVQGTEARSVEAQQSVPGTPGLPTPPKSRAGTPPSPLFAAVDEIDGLRQHSNRNSSLSRRSTGPISAKNSNEDMQRGENAPRRASGYTISNRSSTDSGSNKSGNSRYWNESRSAAIKALYPSSPMAGPPPMERTSSAPVRASSLKKEKATADKATASSTDASSFDFDASTGHKNDKQGPH